MVKVLILGDVHGCFDELNIVVARAFRRHPDITHLVQLGDFGYAWPGCKPFSWLKTFWEKEALDRIERLPFYFLDGNHENHDQLDLDQGGYQPNMIYMPRGSVNVLAGSSDTEDRRSMFFGGASSIDKDRRVEGASWWPQESIKYSQVIKALAQPGPIDIAFSHDYPYSFQYASYKKEFGRADQECLDAVRNHFKPKHWIFGHHHEYESRIHDGTHWACAPVINSRQAILYDGDSIQLIDLNK